MFTAAKDVGEAKDEELSAAEINEEPAEPASFTVDVPAISQKRAQVLRAVSQKLGVSLVKKSRATYWDTSHDVRIVCTISKAYPRSIYRYWYAYHPKWDDFLVGATTRYVVWGCLGLEIAFMIPRDVIQEHLKFLSTTVTSSGKRYWHIKILERPGPTYSIQLSDADYDLPIDEYKVGLNSTS
jgi:hypothetical protein